MLEIIPAIDLMGGQAVRLQKGEFGTSARVAEDPVAVARSFEVQGARRLHVVDLDGARTGEPRNAETIAAILKALTIPVQVGGGLRSVAAAERVLNLGADRVVIGTSAAQDDAIIGAMLDRFADRVIVGADTAEGFVAVKGWQERTDERGEDFARRLVARGARRFLFTDIARDGMLEGVNVEATRTFARAAGVPVIASGGVAGPDDITRLAGVQPDGIEGVIIGKALYSGRLTVADALSLAQGIMVGKGTT